MTHGATRHSFTSDSPSRNSLILIERMQREGASPGEIERAVHETTCTSRPAHRGSGRPRRVRRLLARLT